MGLPRVSVIIPCFNHGRFVAHAVASALAQQGADTRVVIINDGSTDGTTPAACDACGGPRADVIHQANLGLPAARNRGAALAARLHDPDCLVFLDADDWIEPTFVRALAERLARDGGDDASHAYCQERLVELGTGVWEVPDWDPILLLITNLHPVTCLVRRDRFEAVGGFDESMRQGYEDWDLWLRFAERSWRGVRLREPLFVWRRHSPDTMVMNVIHNHEALYRRLMAGHAALYQRHALDLIIRTSEMLRRFDADWIDQHGEPINLAALRRAPEMYESMVAVRLQRRLERAWRRLTGRRPPRAAAPPAQTAPAATA